jgi:hypothetical protein
VTRARHELTRARQITEWNRVSHDTFTAILLNGAWRACEPEPRTQIQDAWYTVTCGVLFTSCMYILRVNSSNSDAAKPRQELR